MAEFWRKSGDKKSEACRTSPDLVILDKVICDIVYNWRECSGDAEGGLCSAWKAENGSRGQVQDTGIGMEAGVRRLVGAVGILCLIGSNAAAHEKKVSVTFAGKIPPKCVLNNLNAAVDLGSLQPKGTASVSFSLTCNADFHFTLSSRNGGLLQAGASAQAPYIALIPYTASLYLGGERISIHHGCKSEHMTGALPSCSGLASANVAAASGQNASLRFSWDSTGSVLMAGSFQDTLLLKVGPEF